MPNTTPDQPLDRDEINLDEVVRILNEVYHCDGYVEMTGGGVATIYAGACTVIDTERWGDGDEYPIHAWDAVCGPGTYQHRDYGISVGSLHELSVAPDYAYIGDDVEYAGCADLGATTEEQIAHLIALQVSRAGENLDADTLEEHGFDSTLRSAPGWLVAEAVRQAEIIRARNARLHHAYDTMAALPFDAMAYADNGPLHAGWKADVANDRTLLSFGQWVERLRTSND